MARRLDTPREGVPRTKWVKGVDGLARPVEPRATRVLLEIASGLSQEEIPYVQQILRDAIGEFISARSSSDLNAPADTLTYVNKRYPELTGIARERKIDEVMLRKAIARKLRRAVDDVEIE
jgi:Ribonuclease G/E